MGLAAIRSHRLEHALVLASYRGVARVGGPAAGMLAEPATTEDLQAVEKTEKRQGEAVKGGSRAKDRQCAHRAAGRRRPQRPTGDRRTPHVLPRLRGRHARGSGRQASASNATVGVMK